MIESRPIPQEAQKEPFRIFFPGMGTHSRSLTGVRSTLESNYGFATYVPSSSVSPFGFKEGEAFGGRFETKAAQIAARAGESDVVIAGHSSGTWEGIDLADALLDTSWSGQNIVLELTAPMGFHRGRSAIVNLAEVKHRADKILRYAREGQHLAYPLAEDYYANVPSEPRPSGLIVIFEDSPDKRAERRELFFQTLEKTTPDEAQRRSLLGQILRLDERISRAVLAKNKKEAERLLEQRAKILFPYMEKLQSGDHHPEALHEKYLEEYQELPHLMVRSRKQIINQAAFLIRNYVGRLPRGMAKSLSAVIDKAHKKGKNVTFSFVMLEKDNVSPLSSVSGLRRQVVARRITADFQGVKLIEKHTHSTLAVWTDATIAIFDSANKK